MSDPLELITEQHARELIRNVSFQKEWESLYQECGWSTPFQSPGFVITWFQVYTSQTPIIVTKYSGDGILTGLLVLSKDVTGKIEFAGSHHAEYKGWLEHGNATHDFIGKALNLVRQHAGQFTLNLSYIYYREQAEILTCECAEFIELTQCNREYKKLTHDTVIPSLKKKGNKSKWNRLCKLGRIEFSRIVDPVVFRYYLEKCSIYHDAWQGAMNNCYPFSSDESKLNFHARLFEKDQGILHVTGMSLDNEPIALHIGYLSDREICYSIIAHNPIYSSYSLGKLLLLRLCELLLDEGFTSLDLSPGGDPWKKDFSSDTAISYKGILHRNAYERLFSSFLNRSRAIASRVGITGNRVRKLSGSVRILTEKLLTSPYRRQILHIYKLEGSDFHYPDRHGYQIRKNDFTDLLLYPDANGRRSKSLFLKESIRRLTDGENVYTYSSNGRLLAYGWLKSDQESDYFAEVGQEYTYDLPGDVLYDIHVQAQPGNQDLYSALVGQMLDDSIRESECKVFYASCSPDSTALTELLENEFGFRILESLHLEKYLHLCRRWKTHRTYEASAGN